MNKYRTKSRGDGVRKENSILDACIASQYKKYWSTICEENSRRFGDMNLEVVSIATVLEAIVKCEIFSKKAETLKVRRQVVQRQFEVRGQPVVKPGRRALLGSFWELEGWSRGQVGTSRAWGTLRQGITSACLIHSSILLRLGCSIFFLWEDYFCFLKLRKEYVWCQKRWRRCMIYTNFIFFM